MVKKKRSKKKVSRSRDGFGNRNILIGVVLVVLLLVIVFSFNEGEEEGGLGSYFDTSYYDLMMAAVGFGGGDDLGDDLLENLTICSATDSNGDGIDDGCSSSERYCDEVFDICVKCKSNSNCGSGTVCDIAFSNTCVECYDLKGVTDINGNIVDLTDISQCSSDQICDDIDNECVECTYQDDSNCFSIEVCDIIDNVCVECEFDEDCSGPDTCNLATKECKNVVCSGSSDCDGYGDGNNFCITGLKEGVEVSWCVDCLGVQTDPLTGTDPRCIDSNLPICFLSACWECHNQYSKDINGNLDINGDNPACVNSARVDDDGNPMNKCSFSGRCVL